MGVNFMVSAQSEGLMMQRPIPRMEGGLDPVAPLNFKRDVLWKPMLRSFRKFLKRDAIEASVRRHIQTSKLTDQGLLLAKALNAPLHLQKQKRTSMAVLMLLNSNRIVIRKRLVPACKQFMGSHGKNILRVFYDTFLDNNKCLRVTFFSEPIIHWLWEIYIREQPQSIISYLASIREGQNGEERHRRFLEDICKLEIECGCAILPLNSQNGPIQSRPLQNEQAMFVRA